VRSLVIYESEYGNTHLIANAIAEGLRSRGEVVVVPVAEADAAIVSGADLIIVGGPTHAHGMSRTSTRRDAIRAAEKPGTALVLDANAAGRGLREWFASLDRVATNAAAFDTRIDLPATLTGGASKGIARKLRRHGATLISEPQSFFVTKFSRLSPNEEMRARDWGAQLGRTLDETAPRPSTPTR